MMCRSIHYVYYFVCMDLLHEEIKKKTTISQNPYPHLGKHCTQFRDKL